MIKFVQSLGFKVVGIVTDNNKINQTMYSLFSKDDIVFENPDFPNDYIYMLYDTVHILKNIRNNWINKSDADKTFYFPHFNDNKILLACFSDLRSLESQNFLQKSFKINHKSLYPTNTERQSVQLAVNIFDRTTIAALHSANNENFEGTIHFLEIFNKWWTIVNNKHANSAVFNGNDENVAFLQKFLKFLERWKNLNMFNGCLTNDTYKAIHQTTSSLIMICKNMFPIIKLHVPGINYLLLGKFQTDLLEARFGKWQYIFCFCYRNF